MKKVTKRILSLLLVAVMICTIIPFTGLQLRASATASRYESLYDGEYSNDMGQYAANIGIANYGRNLDSTYGEAWCADFAYDCWKKAGATSDIIQNFGYAHDLIEFFMNNNPSGVYFRQAGNKEYGTFLLGNYQPHPGDIVGICNDGNKNSVNNSSLSRYCVDHIAMVVSVSDGWIHTVEGNCNDMVQQYDYEWSNESTNGKRKNSTSTYIQYICHPNYSSNSEPPTGAWVSLPNGPESSYLPNTDFYISFGASNATSYTIDIWKSTDSGAEHYWNDTVQSSSDTYNYSVRFALTGHYSCVIRANNANGSTTSSWIGWDIVDFVPSNAWVSLPNGEESSYLLNNEFKISFGADWADTYHLYIWREYGGEKYLYYNNYFTKSPTGDNCYWATFSQLGHYSCYIYATNVVGGTTSGWIGWDIVNEPPTWAKVETLQSSYDFDVPISFIMTSGGGTLGETYYDLYIESENFSKVYSTDGSCINLTFSEEQVGTYTAYVVAKNTGGSVTSDIIHFTILCAKPTWAKVETLQSSYDFDVPISFIMTSGGGTLGKTYYDLYIKSENFSKVYSTDGSCINLTFSEEQVGTYTAYVVAKNTGGSVTSDIIYFTILCSTIHIVTFNSNSGTCSTSNKSVTYNSTYGTLPTPTRTGYTFTGWYTSASGGTKIAADTTVSLTADQTLYAHWEHDTFTLSDNSPIKLDTEKKFIYGENIFSMSKDDLIASFTNNNATVNMSGNRISTGSTISLLDDSNTVYDTLTVVIFGDTNCDSWYDGQDAMLVNCIANGMLTREQVGEAVWAAADCNHDGEINQLDVDLLNQAGVLLESVDQNATQEELQTSSTYQEYLDLIDQSPIDENEPAEDTPTEEKSTLTELIWKLILQLFEIIKSLLA